MHSFFFSSFHSLFLYLSYTVYVYFTYSASCVLSSTSLFHFEKFYFIFILQCFFFVVVVVSSVVMPFVSISFHSNMYIDSIHFLFVSFSRQNIFVVACSISLFKRGSEDWTVAIYVSEWVGPYGWSNLS